MGSTVSAIIRIRNLTNSDITEVSVYDVDSFDFGSSRPDKIFNGTSIPKHSCLERTIDLSTIASNCPFTTKLNFDGGTEDVFRLNYKCIYDSTEQKFRHLTRSHCIRPKRAGPRVLEIIIENTEKQIENQKAEQLLADGTKLMEIGKYTEASVKFMEASQKANESKTIQEIQNQNQKLKCIREIIDDDQKAKILNNEGLQFLKSFKFHEAIKKFNEALDLAKNTSTINLIEDNLKIAKEAKMNQDSKKINQEALLLRKNGQIEAAISKFDEALKDALDPSLINSIKTNKAETLSKQGKETLKKAWFLEIGSFEESIHKFAKAKYLFQEAESVRPSSDYHGYISLIDCRIEGGQFFNTALQLENEGSRLIDKTVKSQANGDCEVVKDKYREAWKCYKEAQRKFEEGRRRDENFERCLGLTVEALNGTERILNGLEKAELEIGFGTTQSSVL